MRMLFRVSLKKNLGTNSVLHGSALGGGVRGLFGLRVAVAKLMVVICFFFFFFHQKIKVHGRACELIWEKRKRKKKIKRKKKK